MAADAQQTRERLSHDTHLLQSLGMLDPKVHSFIVKLWFEDETQRKGMGGWHGHITHVPSGERRYLKELEDIVAFIRPYIGELDRSLVAQIRRWLKC